jgi:hypothetical protein
MKPMEKPFEYPMMPIFGLDLGERLGELAAGQRQMEARLDRLETKIDAVDAKFEAKTDKMAYTLHRLDERTKSLESKIGLSIGLSGAVLAAVLAGIILQFFFK